ncbi:2-amino-4-hydroxy-6-hydroxymethyldihydropteridine diphosphokinase [Sphingomonas elodea]|uniref:2-amino-4-hydroxy-6- hydroxymethyldihydropteridine diphosphokinase n=1 Tax=Sphingomonas elodea TaxID=179878 RepID=UPI0002631DEC|nr:2-amino-4-hydroxy-6-hydroxymethyldihydropteridine diphosphokinase [Sphingomonas elodea]
MPVTSYILALGSNRRGRHGSPCCEVQAALAAIGGVRATSRIHETAPLGPSIRRFANAVAWIDSDETPDALLRRLKRIERAFGRRRGQRWGARVIDLDIVLWSGGCWRGPDLIVPHLHYRTRRFVLAPLAEIAAGWRDPVTGRRTRMLLHAVDRRRPCA